MNQEQLTERISRGEDATTEFKAQFQASSLGKSLCAFANSGKAADIFVGIDDHGNITDIKTPTLSKLKSKILQEHVRLLLQ